MKQRETSTLYSNRFQYVNVAWLITAFVIFNVASSQTILNSLYSPDSHHLSAIGVMGPAHLVIAECSDAEPAEEDSERATQRVYSERGLLLEENRFSHAFPSDALHYYDELDRPFEVTTTHTTSGAELIKVDRSYDELGVVNERVTTYDGSTHSLVERLTGGEEPEVNPSVEHYIAFSLDEQGRMLEQEWFKQGEFDRAYLLNYDERGNVERLDVLYPTGSKDSYYYTYDKYGNILTEARKYPWEEQPIVSQQFSYVYDDYGSWTERHVELRNPINPSRSGPVHTQCRKITYYSE